MPVPSEGTKVSVTGAEEVKTLLGKIPEQLFSVAKDAFADAVFKAHEEITNRLQGTPMQSRTGHLARSIKTSVTGNKFDDLQASIYSSFMEGGVEVPYAPVHEFGATIRAKDKYKKVPGGPYLNLPLPDNKTPAGVMRMSAKMVFDAGGYLFKSKSGNWIVSNKQGDPMFVLKKQVKIPARLGMVDSAEKQLPGLLAILKNLNFQG